MRIVRPKLPSQRCVEAPDGLARGGSVDLRVREAPARRLDQLEDECGLGLVAHDVDLRARAAHAPGEGARLAQKRRETHEPPVVGEGPEDGPEMRTTHDGAEPGAPCGRMRRAAEGFLRGLDSW